MILSYHPCFVGDQNRLCAGRNPDGADLRAIGRADAVILPQGTSARLYEMATKNCRHVFPNYTARYRYPGKSAQIRLFQKIQTPHPTTWLYNSFREYHRETGARNLPKGLQYPCIFKFDWGGEGDNVKLLRRPQDLAGALEAASACEQTGQKGFLLQSAIPAGNRSLRVVVIGQKESAYWKIQPDAQNICAGVRKGAWIDPDSDPSLQQIGIERSRRVCTKTGINLAAFDLLFAEIPGKTEPLFLEINYYFGRKGLGGSKAFYEKLIHEIRNWIHRNRLKQPCTRKRMKQS